MRGSYGMQEVQQIKRESAPYPGAQRPLSFQQPVEVGGGGIPMSNFDWGMFLAWIKESR